MASYSELFVTFDDFNVFIENITLNDSESKIGINALLSMKR